MRISAHGLSPVQTLPSLLSRFVLFLGCFPILPLLACFQSCHPRLDVGLRNDGLALEHAPSLPVAYLHDYSLNYSLGDSGSA